MNAIPITALGLFLTVVSWLDALDQGTKILTGLGALIVMYFAIRAHISRKKLTDFQLRKEQDAERIKSNGRAK